MWNVKNKTGRINTVSYVAPIKQLTREHTQRETYQEKLLSLYEREELLHAYNTETQTQCENLIAEAKELGIKKQNLKQWEQDLNEREQKLLEQQLPNTQFENLEVKPSRWHKVNNC